MMEFDIIEYIGGLTTYIFDRTVLIGIARDRGLLCTNSYEELEQKHKDLLLADLLFKVYTGANTTASISQSNGSTKVAIGGQSINDKSSIYNVMCSLYEKWGDEKLSLVSSLQNVSLEIIDGTKW